MAMGVAELQYTYATDAETANGRSSLLEYFLKLDDASFHFLKATTKSLIVSKEPQNLP